MSNPNKNKGKRVEREVADLFEKATQLSWQRVPNSGAFIGGKNVTRIASLSSNQILLSRGDIIPPDEYKGIVIEVKGRASFCWHLLLEKHKEFEAWVDQTLESFTVSQGKFFCIVFKINRRGFYIAFPSNTIKIDDENFITYNYKDKKMLFTIMPLSLLWIIKYKEQILKMLANNDAVH